MQIIVKNWEHVNKAFGNWDTPNGKHVKNKDHYDRLMKEGKYITYEEGLERSKNNGKKPYVLSKKAWELIAHAKNKANSKGRVKLEGKFGEELVKMGAISKKIPNYMQLPAAYTGKGGFSK